MNVRLSEEHWENVVQALDHTITIIDKIDPKLLGASYESKDKWRYLTTLQQITAQLHADDDRQFN